MGIDNVSDTREKILKIVIMQKKNLKRNRGNDEHSNFNSNSNSNRDQPKPKNFKNSKPQQQFQQLRSSNNQQNSKFRQQSTRTSNKRIYNIVNSNSNLKNVKY